MEKLISVRLSAWSAVKWIRGDRDSIVNPIKHELNIWRNENGRQ